MPITRLTTLSTFLLCLFVYSYASAQLSGRSFTVARHGKLPNVDDKAYPTIYTDWTLEYRYSSFLAGMRAAGFEASEIGTPYASLSQRYLEYEWDWGSVRAGNSYGMFGRGLIFRAFELPGFVNESRVFRTQHSVIRDVDGFNFQMQPGPFNVKFIVGNMPVNALDPPEMQIDGDLIAGQASVDLPGNLTIGTAYLEYETALKDKLSTYFAGWSADALLEKINADALTLDLYTEYATNIGYGKIAEFDSESSHAFYVAGNFSWKKLGGSVEYKDYQAFDFGINDPPPLIRENSEYLLNRITHRLDVFGETGFQTEVYYAPWSLSRFTVNLTSARNNSDNLFLQHYIGFENFGSPWSSRAFFDYGKEEFLSEPHRFTLGAAGEYSMNDGTSLGLDVQWQYIERFFSENFNYTFTNFYTSMSVQDWHKFSLALSLERSTDPDVTLVNPQVESAAKYFLYGSIGWTPNPWLFMSLFAGERRRSTKCDHGFCIEVLDFKGMELRFDISW